MTSYHPQTKLWEGNVFTASVCQWRGCIQGRDACTWVASRGVFTRCIHRRCIPGVVQQGCASGGCIQGRKCIQRVHLGVHPGACIQGVGCRWMYPAEDRWSRGGWYTSYWNGYLLPSNKWYKTGMLTISRCHTCIVFWTK